LGVLVANLYLIVVILIVLLVIGFVVWFVRRGRAQAERAGEVSNARRRRRDQQQP
jgi:heme/copper-type cytochrome/quinol oxidase subunit 2